MKKFILIATALLGIVAHTSANDNLNRHFNKGYAANIQLSATDIDIFHITTSHGWAFGNGLYVGGGAGFGAEWWGGDVLKSVPRYVPSLFVEARWSIVNDKVSPFVAINASQYIDLTELNTNYGITPALGLDMGRMSLSVGYAFRGERSAMQVGVAFNF